ncbi:MAG: hypothetical protein OEV64_07380 [Desulfobulbaceae bacterium]|nr:hypothetical protein [Desulfobulbaceae bacterium]
MLRYLIVSTIIIFFLVTEAKSVEIIDSFFLWKTKGRELFCSMTREHEDDDSIFIIEQKIDGKNIELLRQSPGAFPYWIAGHGDYAVAAWRTGVGYLVFVYEFNGKTVKEVFNDGSYLMPEMAHYGQRSTPAIIVASEFSDHVINGYIHSPLTANVYLLGEDKVTTIKKIPWLSRMGSEEQKK